MPEEDRSRWPTARYAALKHHGQRFRDVRSGQEHWHRPVGVDDLLEAGASIENPDEVRIPHHVKIYPARDETWAAQVSRTQIRPDDPKDDGVMQFVGTQQCAETQTLDTRPAAVEWAKSQAEDYRRVEVQEVGADA